jgi:ATP-dependent RNA helicase RhlE
MNNDFNKISSTTGRLIDHIYSGRIDFVDLSVLVLDEVDRMLDMGFLPDIQNILRLLPTKRQNLVFSATLPSEIQKLVHQILHNPATVEIGQRSSPAVGIRHAVYPVPRHLKTELLLQLLRQPGMNSVLIFTRTKSYASRLTDALSQRGIKVSVLHGDRSQSQRLRALEQFRKGRAQVMVATDIAARGIDIDDISHVINFDVPNTPEDYVHRIGRTARAEATGDAFSLVASEEEPMIKEIERTLNRPLPRVTLPTFDYKRSGPGGGPHQGRPGHGRGNQGRGGHGGGGGGDRRRRGRGPHGRPGPHGH